MTSIPPMGERVTGPHQAKLYYSGVCRIHVPTRGTKGRRMYIFTASVRLDDATLEIRNGLKLYTAMNTLKQFGR